MIKLFFSEPFRSGSVLSTKKLNMPPAAAMPQVMMTRKMIKITVFSVVTVVI